MTNLDPQKVGCKPFHMSDTDHEYFLPEADARHIFRSLARVAKARGLATQKNIFASDIARCVGADYWLWHVARLAPDHSPLTLSVQHNLSDQHFSRVADERYGNLQATLPAAVADQLTVGHGHWTGTLEQLLDGAADRDPQLLDTCREHLDFEHTVLSFRQVPETDVIGSGLIFHRSRGREPFTPREIRIVHLVCNAVDWLHHQSVPEREDGQNSAGLPPRLRTVLTLLMDGQAPKQIALNLHLSEHTVRGYIKEIYRHFDVSGRPELMRRFMLGDENDVV